MLRCGTAELVITPTHPVEISGWHFGRSAGVLQDLEAHVLLLEEADVRVAILSLDILGVDAAFVAALRSRVVDRCGVSHVLINASHTHSGPAGHDFRGAWGKKDPAYIDALLHQLTEATHLAAERLKPAQVSVTTRKVPGLTCCSPTRNRESCVDDELGVIEVADLHGRTQAALIVFSCHAVCLHGYRRLLAPDFVGYLRERVRQQVPHITVGFLSGAAGDTMPAGFRGAGCGEPSLAQGVGCTLADHAVELLRMSQPAVAPQLEAAQRLVSLPLEPLPSERHLRDMIAAAESERARTPEAGRREECETLVDWASEAMRAAASGKAARSLAVELQVIQIGEVALLGVPLEVYAQVGLEIRQRSPFPHTFVLGQSNGSFGYLATGSAYDMESYTVRQAAWRYGLQALHRTAAEQVVTDATALLHEVHAARRSLL